MDDLSRINRAMMENVSTERVWKPPSKRKAEDRRQKRHNGNKREKNQDDLELDPGGGFAKLGGQLVIYKVKGRLDFKKGQEEEQRMTKKIDIII